MSSSSDELMPAEARTSRSSHHTLQECTVRSAASISISVCGSKHQANMTALPLNVNSSKSGSNVKS